VLPIAPHVATVQLDLYIEDKVSCGIGFMFCGVDDNRPFVQAGKPDPHADPSRNRVHMTFDFSTGTLTVRLSPSCKIERSTPNKECFPPKNIDDGTVLTTTDNGDGSVTIDSEFVQSAYAPASVCKVINHFTVQPDDSAGNMSLVGDGSNFPDLVLIEGGSVVYSDRGTHLTNLCPPEAFVTRKYDFEPGSRNGPPTGPGVEVTSYHGFKYRLSASKPQDATQVTDAFYGTVSDAPPGEKFITMELNVANAAGDRTEPLAEVAYDGGIGSGRHIMTELVFGVSASAQSQFACDGQTASGWVPLYPLPRRACEELAHAQSLTPYSGDEINQAQIPAGGSVTLLMATPAVPATAPQGQIALFFGAGRPNRFRWVAIPISSKN
jgi:hypothetical protein